MSRMKIILPSGNAMGATYGGIVVQSPDEFSWEEGKLYLEKHLDANIVRHNLLVQYRAKKTGKKLYAFYQWVRDGPIVKCLYGPTIDPKRISDHWYCKYRYKAKIGTSEEYLKEMWWNKPRKEGTPKQIIDFFQERMEEENDEPLY